MACAEIDGDRRQRIGAVGYISGYAGHGSFRSTGSGGRGGLARYSPVALNPPGALYGRPTASALTSWTARLRADGA